MQNILITYASKYGSTGEIAAVIHQELLDHGLNVTLLPVEMLEHDSLYDYGAVILGSALYMGQWLDTAKHFLTAHQAALMTRPLWVFSSGPTGDEAITSAALPADIAALVKPLNPRSVTLFHGKLDPKLLTLAERMLLKLMHPPQGDFRDWDAVRQWCAEISAELRPIPL